MIKTPLLAGLVLLALPSTGTCAEVTGRVEAPRGLQTLHASGDAPAGAARVSLRVLLEDREALRLEAQVQSGRWTVVRRCSPRLAPARYRLSVEGPNGKAWAEGELRVGTPEDEARARAQQREFFRGVIVDLASAHGGLEDMAWKVYASKSLDADKARSLGEGAKRQVRGTATALRMFDLRAAQPYRPRVREACAELARLAVARADVWIAVGEAPSEAPPAQDPRVAELAEILASELELPTLSARFTRSEFALAERPVPPEGGRWTSELGFSLELPKGTQARDLSTRLLGTEIRLVAAVPPGPDSPGAELIIRVARVPFAVDDFEGFVRFVEVENWEREGLFTGYRRLAAAPDPEHNALRLRFTGHLRDLLTAEGAAVEGRQIALYEPKRRLALFAYLFGSGVDDAVLESIRWEDR